MMVQVENPSRCNVVRIDEDWWNIFNLIYNWERSDMSEVIKCKQGQGGHEGMKLIADWLRKKYNSE